MKVSLNTIKQYIDFELPPVGELVRRINEQLGGVEEVTDLSAKYKGIVIAKVVTCYPHPDSDHLHVCEIDPGDYTLPPTVDRLPSGHVQVVCGAPNVREGLMVAWLPPGATVPASYDKDPFVLEARKIRGVVSNGMLASPAELAIGDNHDGILELTEKDISPQNPCFQGRTLETGVGMDFARVFGLDDTIIDIENKMFTHRPDCFGQLGVAREIAGILGHSFASPKWYIDPFVFPKPLEHLELDVFNDIPATVPRFMAVAMKNVSVAPSPFWLQCELVRLGSKPINTIVDATNYLMLQTAQPTHAYDYDKLRGQRLGARLARDGETVRLLNGKTYTLTSEDIVIADAEGPVGVGGIMGGGDSEVSAATKNIVLEVANFDMYAIRKTSMRHGLFTDAVTRFSKGQSPLQCPVVTSRGISYLLQVAGGSVASDVLDCGAEEASLTKKEVETSVSFINERLGLRFDETEAKTLLSNVEFSVDPLPSSVFRLSPPFWRTDIELPEDIVEEVGRLYGFDKLPRELPARSMKPAPQNPNIEMKRKITQILSGAGANEVKTYSFVHERVLKAAGQDAEQAFRLGNALSPDLQYYRVSILPSLLDKVHGNSKAGHDEFALFEFGKAHRKGDLDDEGLPREYERLALVYAAKKSPHAAYYTVRRYVEALSSDLAYVPLTDFDASEYPIFEQLAKPFDPRRAAVLMDGDHFVGVVGEFTAATRRAFKLPEAAAGFELFQSFLRKLRPQSYAPLSRFPHVTQDISLKVAVAVPFGEVYAAALAALKQQGSDSLRLQLSPLAVYQPEDGGSRTITLRLKAVNYDRTLTDAEVTTYLDAIAAATAQTHKAEKV